MLTRKIKILKNLISAIMVSLTMFFAFIGLVNVLFKLIYCSTNVKGFSMRPTLNMTVNDPNANGDTIYINRFASFTNNDIVVAKVDWHEDYIIKRVVGTPGDLVQIKDLGTQFGVYVNGDLLYTRGKDQGTYQYHTYYLNFLDNPSFAKNVALIDDEKYIILGEDEYLLMGDNWGYTTDGIQKGVTHKDEVIGKVDLIIKAGEENRMTATLFMLKKIFSFS